MTNTQLPLLNSVRRSNRPDSSNGYNFPEAKGFCDVVRVVSYNIRGETTLDRENGNPWRSRKCKIQYLMQKYRPDIIALQEVKSNYISDLLELFPQYQCIAFDSENRDNDVALLVSRSRFTIEKKNYFWLSEDPFAHVVPLKTWDAKSPRMVVYVELYDRQTSRKYVVFGVHFDSAGITSRVKSAQVLVQQQWQIAPNLPVIVLGDFNLMIDPRRPDMVKKTEDAYGILTGQSALHDIRDFECDHYGPDGSWIGWEYDKYAVPPNCVGERLDHIFVKQCHVLQEGVLDLKVNDDFTSLIYPNDSEYLKFKYPSDHLPIIADIEVL